MEDFRDRTVATLHAIFQNGAARRKNRARRGERGRGAPGAGSHIGRCYPRNSDAREKRIAERGGRVRHRRVSAHGRMMKMRRGKKMTIAASLILIAVALAAGEDSI